MPSRARPRSRLSLKAKLIWGTNLALGTGLALLINPKINHAQNRAPPETRRIVAERSINEKPRARVATLPSTPLSFKEIPSNGNWCAKYVRLSAAKLFGMTYTPADAWNFAAQNRSVWKKGSPTPFQQALKPGYVLGVFNPSSKYNSPERPYTHVVIYLGNDTVMHRVGVKNKIEKIESMLKSLSKGDRNAEIKEIIAPKGR